LCVIDEKELSPTFGLSCFNSRKSGEWEQDGFVLGWINSNDVKHARLPHPFQSSDRKWWLDWFSDKADGVYEVKGLLLSIRRINSRVLAIAAKSIKHLDLELQKKKFLLFFISSLLGLALLLFSVIYRANSGAALSIRWQMLGLFALAVFIPGAGLFYVGNELLRDRRSFYENDAFNKLEKFKKEIEKNREYVFREVEKMGDRFSRQLIELYDPNASEPFDRIKSRQLVKEFSRKANMEFVFVFDSAGEEVLADQKHSSSRKGLLPLVTSLAKLKLRIKGKLAESKMTGAVSLMDLLIEETGGSKMADVQNVLRSKSASAFELKFSDRRSYFFVGEAVPKDYPDEIFVMAFILRDKHFEEVYLRLMAEMFSRENLINDNVQMFFGKNSFSQMDYFEKVNFANPFFIVDRNNADLVSLGRLTEPTRFAGLPVKGSFGFKNGRRALFYSFRPAGIDNYSVAVLYDYQDIEKRVSELAIVLFVVFLVSVLILYVLTRITIRAIITPVSLLKDAVSAVNQGDYRCRVIFPGRDELVSLADAYNKMTKGLDERERMTKYLSRSAIEAVKTAKENVLGGQKVFATILFSDIRSFTTISENHSAEEVVSLLNDYFTRMNQVIEAHDGDIDKFIGDAIMAQFISYDKSYQPPEQMAMKAVKCALQMMKALDEFNRERLSRNLFPIKIGIGLNSGELIAGNIGAQGRMDHTVIGDVVNVASRLEGMSKFGNHTHIVISRSTLDLLGDRVKCVKLEQTAVKGKTQAVEMFEVISLVMSS
jgi:class 3 adenylate cyclase